MSSPMNTLLLGLTMYDTCLIVTSVLMVGIPSINNYHYVMINSNDSEEEPIFNLYMSSIFPFLMPILYPVSWEGLSAEKIDFSIEGEKFSMFTSLPEISIFLKMTNSRNFSQDWHLHSGKDCGEEYKSRLLR